MNQTRVHANAYDAYLPTRAEEQAEASPLSAIAPEYSPEMIERVMGWIEPVYKHYFRCEWRGAARIPERPAFIVANHNATGAIDVFMMLYAWYSRFGHSRPVHGLAHKMVFETPIVKELLPKLGAVPANPRKAHEVLEAGCDLAVFPGGDWEACRPYTDAGKIDFGGRKGFVRVALETGALISPFVLCGAHESSLILDRGTGIAHALGIDTLWRTKTVPLGLPLSVLPSKVTMESLDPIDLRAETAGIEDPGEKLQHGYDIVTSRMQECMDHLQAEREGYLG